MRGAAEALGELRRVEEFAEAAKYAEKASIIADAGFGYKYIFKADSAVQHFEKHAGQVMSALGRNSYNLKNYIDDANYVVSAGQYVPELNGHIKLVGGRGSAKYAFVGVDGAGKRITTFHIKSLKEIFKKAPSLGIGL